KFSDVAEYSLSKDGMSLVYTVASKNEETNGAYAVSTNTADPPTALLAGKGKYTKLSWDEKQTHLVFLSDHDEAAAAQPRFKLYHWDRKGSSATEVVSNSTPNFGAGSVISDKGPISFSNDGRRVFFGVAPPPEPDKPDKDDDDATSDDKVVADLWHWKDDYIQPMQKVRAERERNRSYKATFDLAEKRFVRLADETMPAANTSAAGRWAIGLED